MPEDACELVNSGADIHAEDNEGDTPFDLAVNRENHSTAWFLLYAGSKATEEQIAILRERLKDAA